jgi:hypothetical protein
VSLLQSGQVRKADLQKKKNDDEVEEGWVQCDACESWVHQICGLFNKGKNDQNVHYLCPKCLILVRGWSGWFCHSSIQPPACGMAFNSLIATASMQNSSLLFGRFARHARRPPWLYGWLLLPPCC